MSIVHRRSRNRRRTTIAGTAGLEEEDLLPEPEVFTSLSCLLNRKEQIVQKLMKYSGWSKPWTQNLWMYCNSMCDYNGIISKNEFIQEMASTFGVTNMFYLDRSYGSFRNYTSDVMLRPEGMFKGITLFLSNDITKKADYAFSLFDSNGDGHISLMELKMCLDHSVLTYDMEDRQEALAEIFGITKSYLRLKTDSFLTREEFRARVVKNEQMLCYFGRCLPEKEQLDDFLDSIDPHKYKDFELEKILEMKSQDSVFRYSAPVKYHATNYYPIQIEIPMLKDVKHK